MLPSLLMTDLGRSDITSASSDGPETDAPWDRPASLPGSATSPLSGVTTLPGLGRLAERQLTLDVRLKITLRTQNNQSEMARLKQSQINRSSLKNFSTMPLEEVAVRHPIGSLRLPDCCPVKSVVAATVVVVLSQSVPDHEVEVRAHSHIPTIK